MSTVNFGPLLFDDKAQQVFDSFAQEVLEVVRGLENLNPRLKENLSLDDGWTWGELPKDAQEFDEFIEELREALKEKLGFDLEENKMETYFSADFFLDDTCSALIGFALNCGLTTHEISKFELKGLQLFNSIEEALIEVAREHRHKDRDREELNWKTVWGNLDPKNDEELDTFDWEEWERKILRSIEEKLGFNFGEDPSNFNVLIYDEATIYSTSFLLIGKIAIDEIKLKWEESDELGVLRKTF